MSGVRLIHRLLELSKDTHISWREIEDSAQNVAKEQTVCGLCFRSSPITIEADDSRVDTWIGLVESSQKGFDQLWLWNSKAAVAPKVVSLLMLSLLPSVLM